MKTWKFITLGAALFWSLLASSLAQVAVYRIEFKVDSKSINFPFYEEGYLVAPALGGEATLILTVNDTGQRLYTRSDNAGQYYLSEEGGRQYMVFAASTNNGGIGSFYLASGKITSYLRSKTSRSEIKVKVPQSLHGRILTADPETDTEEISGFGVAGYGEMSAYLLKKRSARNNDHGLTQSEVSDQLIDLLETYGYRSEEFAASLTNAQLTVNTATAALQTAMNNEATAAEIAALEEAVASAQTALQTANTNGAADGEITALEEALATAQADLQATTDQQAEITALEEALAAAQAALEALEQ